MNDRDALEAGGTGEEAGKALQRGASIAKNGTKASINGAKDAYNLGKGAADIGRHLHDSGIKEGAKELAKGTAKKAVNNVANKINNSAPAKAAKATYDLAKIVQNKGVKEGAKHVGKGAAKGVAKVAGKALKKVLARIFGFFMLPLVLLAILFVIICANTPAMIMSAIGGTQVTQEEATEKLNNFSSTILPGSQAQSIVSNISFLFVTARDWYYEKEDGEITVKETGEVVTQEELDRLNAAGDYDGVLTFYTEVTQHYLDQDYEDLVTEVTNYANEQADKTYDENTYYDSQKTISTIGENPFTDVDYANIIACYSTTDDYETALLSRYKTKLRDAEFITYTKESKSETNTSYSYDEEGEHITKTKTLWDEITVVPYSSTEIFDIFGINANDTYPKSKSDRYEEITYEQAYSEYYTTLTNKLEKLGYTSGGCNVTGNTYGTVLTEEEIEGYLKSLPSGTSKNRKQIIKVALGVVGRIPYNNTGNRSYPYYGWNSEWGKPSGNKKHPYIGIDCSGFVQWVYRNALCDKDGNNPDNIYQSLITSGTITSNKNLKQIATSDLKPGDIGAKFVGGSSGTNWNHVGIYMGNNRWIHCSGGSGTVVVSENYDVFTCFFRVKTDSIEKDNYWTDDTYLPFMKNIFNVGIPGVTEDEMTILATTLCHEFNQDDGFRACAEAVYHKSKYENKDMYHTIIMKNKGGAYYSSSYEGLYVTHKYNAENFTPTSHMLKSLEQVMNGELIHFPNSKYPYPVMYFFAIPNSQVGNEQSYLGGWNKNAVFVEHIPAPKTTVYYYYIPDVTYSGYK